MPPHVLTGSTATMIVGRQQNDVYLNHGLVWSPQGPRPVHGARRLCFLVCIPTVCFVYCQVYLQLQGAGQAGWHSSLFLPPVVVAGQVHIPGVFLGPLLAHQPWVTMVPAIQGPPAGPAQTIAMGYFFYWAHNVTVAANQGAAFFYYRHHRPPRAAVTRPRTHIPRGPHYLISWSTQMQNYRYFD